MAEIFKVLIDDLLILVASLTLLGGLMVTNMILGAVMSATVGEFDKPRFLRSVIKALLILFAVCIYYACLELMPYLLNKVGVDIPSDLVTTIEVLLVVVASFTKYAREIFKKLLTLFDVIKPESNNESDEEIDVVDVEDVNHQLGVEGDEHDNPDQG